MTETSPSRNWPLVLVAGLLVLAACLLIYFFILPVFQTSEAPQPGPEPVPPTTADPWERIQSTGKLIVGTSADYPPFEYYNDQFQIDGFDPALIRLIGEQLGVQVELHDFAFEGLGSALQLGQIDVGISTISITSERQALVDFSNVYFVSEDAVLGNAAASIPPPTSINDLALRRVGVQSGTIYESALQDQLVSTGLMPSSNLFTYPRIDQAISDLAGGRIDLVILDRLPAERFANQGGVSVVAVGLIPQQYAIAVSKGATTLLGRINGILAEFYANGTIAQLSDLYLNQAPGAISPPTQPTAAPSQPTPTNPPSPACFNGMAFVSDLNLPDNQMKDPPVIPAGQPFLKGWRIRNSGTCAWDSSYFLGYAYGNVPAARMGGQPTYIQGSVPPGGQYDIYVNLIAPIIPGVYQGVWEMHAGNSQAFGERIWVGIEVPLNPTSPPPPTQTPAPNISFNADPTTIPAGGSATFTWNVQNAAATYFYAQGQPWQDNQVSPSGGQVVYPPQTTIYELRVVSPANTVEIRQIRIDVTSPPPGAPEITRFSVSPPGEVSLGGCVTLQWSVQGPTDVVQLLRSGQEIWGYAPLTGSHQDCPPQAGDIVYTISTSGSGGQTQRSLAVEVLEPLPTPEPTPLPIIPSPTIEAFSVSPETIDAGGCFNISWVVGGGSERVQLLRNGQIVYEGTHLTANGQDCQKEPGVYSYNLVAYGGEDQSVSQEASGSVQAIPTPDPVVGVLWQLVGYVTPEGTIALAPQEVEITLLFHPDGTLSGESGCNQYNAPYQLHNPNLEVGDISTSKQVCTTPDWIMDFENYYLKLLGQANAVQLDSSQLILLNSEQQPTMVFQAGAQPR